MNRFILITSTALGFAVGCVANDRTGSVASAVNGDPGTTSLSFHSPSGIDVQIQSVTPMGQPDPIYIQFSGITGERGDGSEDIMFRGDVIGASNPQQYAAAIAPLTATLLGLATPDQVQETLSLTFGPLQIHYAQQPLPCETSLALVQQATAYALLKEGPTAGALARSYVESLSIAPCLVVKGH